ncbi:tail fiber assembly protein [Enterobacter asburiae]|uniref:tail fiber assembly protein n=1 Tax=Enterobacter asburiae TaxID=61645 RepID=UPI00210B859F|nr:tail fiber assembly protein [Enterobacter asburiae]MCQ4369976.1 tail fiber assembly protein [Enterobacter asburiae]HDC4619832.1 tail fiber assembly protein [Enterobacter asburiae]
MMTMQSGVFKRYDPLELWGGYSADEVSALSPEEAELYYLAKTPGVNLMFLRDESGNDWYQWLKTLPAGSLKVSFDPDTKEIIHFNYDANAIFPQNQIVAEVRPKDVPAEFTAAGDLALGGAFLFDNGKIVAAPVNHVAEAERKKATLMSDAEAAIAPLKRAVKYNMATDAEKASLEQWEVYSVLLSRVDTSLAPDIEWPPVPA